MPTAHLNCLALTLSSLCEEGKWGNRDKSDEEAQLVFFFFYLSILLLLWSHSPGERGGSRHGQRRCSCQHPPTESRSGRARCCRWKWCRSRRRWSPCPPGPGRSPGRPRPSRRGPMPMAMAAAGQRSWRRQWRRRWRRWAGGRRWEGRGGRNHLGPGLEKPGFFYIKKPSPVVFLLFFFVFLYIFAQKREFIEFFSVSRILLGASRR